MPKGNQTGRVELHNGKLRIVYHVEGKRRTESTGLAPGKEGSKAAGALLRRRLAEIETGQYVAPQKAAGPATRLFRDYADTWVTALSGAKNREGQPYKPASIERYRRLLRAWSLHLGDKPMASLTKTDVKAAEVKLLAGMSQNHGSNLMVVLKKMLRQAEADGVAARLTSEMKSPLPEKRRLVDGDVWSKEEAATIPGIAAEIDPSFGAFCALGLMTGMRCGELRALRLDNLDLPGRIIRVRLTAAEDYRKGDIVGKPKTRISLRDLDIDDRVVAVLRAQIKRMMGKSEWLFPDHLDARQPLRYWKMQSWFQALGKKLGRYLVPHRLRHTFASTSLTGGILLSEVAAYMGDTQATVEAVYFTWANKEARRKAASRFASMYDSAPHSAPDESPGVASS